MNKNVLGKLLLVVIGFSMLSIWNKYNHAKVDAISFATITTKINGLKKNKISYNLYVEGVEYGATYHGQRGDDVRVGENFVAVYESNNPDNNNIIFNMRYINELQLDSLREKVDPQDLIKWWEY